MAVSVEMHNTGDPALRAELATVIEHVLSQRSGDWRVLIVGSQANDQWEMKIAGPTAHHGGLEEVSGSGLRRRRFSHSSGTHLAH